MTKKPGSHPAAREMQYDQVEETIIHSIFLGCPLVITPVFIGVIISALNRCSGLTASATIPVGRFQAEFMGVGVIIPEDGQADHWLVVLQKVSNGWEVASIPWELVRMANEQLPVLLVKMRIKAVWADTVHSMLRKPGRAVDPDLQRVCQQMDKLAS